MKFLLLVTWLTLGQPPVSYQVDFLSIDACRTARAELIGDEQRIRSEAGKNDDGKGRAFRSPSQVPALSAVCVER